MTDAQYFCPGSPDSIPIEEWGLEKSCLEAHTLKSIHHANDKQSKREGHEWLEIVSCKSTLCDDKLVLSGVDKALCSHSMIFIICYLGANIYSYFRILIFAYQGTKGVDTLNSGWLGSRAPKRRLYAVRRSGIWTCVLLATSLWLHPVKQYP